MWVFVDAEDAIKFTVVRVKNISPKLRKLSVTGYVEWVLGDTATSTRMHVVTEKTWKQAFCLHVIIITAHLLKEYLSLMQMALTGLIPATARNLLAETGRWLILKDCSGKAFQ